MPSSKGKPTDPKLREQVKDEVKNETNKDGGGKGQWSAWKAAKLSKEYEKKGGSYENEAGTKNEPKKGTPQPKTDKKRRAEEKEGEKPKDESSEKGKQEAKGEEGVKKQKAEDVKEKTKPKDKEPASEQKPKANTGKKKQQPRQQAEKDQEKTDSSKAKAEGTLKGKGKERTEGTRRSGRIAGKRAADGAETDSPARKKKA